MPFSGDDDHQTLVKVAKADWDFDDECFDDLSHDAMEFIEGLLVKDPRHVLKNVRPKFGSILTYEFSTFRCLGQTCLMCFTFTPSLEK